MESATGFSSTSKRIAGCCRITSRALASKRLCSAVQLNIDLDASTIKLLHCLVQFESKSKSKLQTACHATDRSPDRVLRRFHFVAVNESLSLCEVDSTHRQMIRWLVLRIPQCRGTERKQSLL
jgi:hypothetical protein